MANPEGGGVNRTIDDGNAVVNSGSMANKNDPDAASDTEQHSGVDATSQRQGSKKKACFEITRVNAAEHDPNLDDADSNDELDESRLEDYSFNVSRNSISDHERSLDDGVNSVPLVPSASGSAEEHTNSVPTNPNQANGNGPHRFKVVKVATTEPIRKGRWTCRDFPSESSKVANQTAPDSVRNQDSNINKEALVHSGNSSAASSVHFVHGQDNNSDNPLAQGDESGKQLDLSRKISSTSSKDVGNQNEDDQKDEKLGLEQLKDELQEHTSESTEGDDGTSPAGGAIDNKIEQAMDLVKSHLLFAVREEVEVLKEQIKILVEKNEMLQEENSSLKQRLTGSGGGGAPPPVSAGMGLAAAPSAHTQQQQQQHQSMAMSSQDQSYPSMPNKIGQANLGKNPMGQTMSDHAAYPQHPRPTQQTHSTPNPAGLPESTPQYTPQTSVESQGSQYHGVHSQMHIQGMPELSQYSQVGGSMAASAPQTTPQPAQQTQGQYHTSMAPGAAGSRQNTTH